MSTRALITIKGCEHAIYKHCDGYPDGILPWLKPIVAAFHKERGDDPSYLLAQIVRQYVFSHENKADDTNRLLAFKFTGWGIVGPNDDLGQEYEYEIDAKTGKIKVITINSEEEN